MPFPKSSIPVFFIASILAHASVYGILTSGNRLYRSSGGGVIEVVGADDFPSQRPKTSSGTHTHRKQADLRDPDLSPDPEDATQAEPSEPESSGGAAAGGGGETLEEDQVDEPAKLTYMPKLRYPPEALRQGIEGEVELYLELDVRGRVVRYEVSRGGGHGFDAVALQVAPSLVFTPALKEGRPVPVHLHWTCRFRVDD